MVTYTPSEFAEMRARIERARAGRAGLTVEKVAREALKKPKHKNIKTNGFDSWKEYRDSITLNALADSGVIQHLRKQVPFVLQESFKDAQGVRHRPIKYIADFVYEKDGKTYVHETKSAHTRRLPVYRIKRKLFAVKYPDIVFIENY